MVGIFFATREPFVDATSQPRGFTVVEWGGILENGFFSLFKTKLINIIYFSKFSYPSKEKYGGEEENAHHLRPMDPHQVRVNAERCCHR